MAVSKTRSVTVLIAALGGEGGGVLTDWLIEAANQHDFPVQSTSIPGVAQRTGATTYYVEIFPQPRSELGGKEPILSLTPSPGSVDAVVASEIVEAGRAIQRGWVTPGRTTLVASTHREYAVVEKTAMGDGRYDTQPIVDAATQLARTAVFGDLRALALANGTVINTVMFGALVGAGALPLSRAACEEAIRRTGKAVQASLAGFAAGYALAVSGGQPTLSAKPAQQGAAPAREGKLSARLAAYPQALRTILSAGIDQVGDYQDARYVETYLGRVDEIVALERDAGGGAAGYPVSLEAARYLALWMSYEDVIRVADLKTRRERLQRVRAEVGAKPDEPVMLVEYLKPGIEELCSVLPKGMASLVRRWGQRRGADVHVGLHVKTTSISGFAMLVALRSLRRWRRHSARFHEEQALIGEWLAAIRAALPRSAALAYELALCGNLVKGYGQTHLRGRANLRSILDDVTKPGTRTNAEQVTRLQAARRAALADPESRTLAKTLGLPAPEIQARPIRFSPNPKRA
ncbi:indolepyruvate oxidoreductase [Pandoraea capi]|uniref:Indolepyruvate oxidoreductase n=1 Tax=Pandoraea capi TaxID=2508286 RepID=A0ABY6W4T5_9BURK|nr:indolepyruvate oxidoreductase subunit beta family protein [Pandoraea capi]VVE26698.1 indolepyruvate oxidoreductase [Pandoraea capi]